MQVVSDFVTAVQQGNQEVLAKLLHPEIKWEQPGNNAISGIKQSNTEVFQMVGSMYEITQGSLLLAEIKSIAVHGNTAACLLRFTGTRPGAELDVDNIDVYTVKDGKITGAKIFSADPEQEDLFWQR